MGGSEPGSRAGEAGSEGREPRSIRLRRRIDDRWLMLLLIPTFGIAISQGAGLFGTLDPSDAAWWWGHLWFVAGAAVIYGTNRALLFAGRSRADWFSGPMTKLALLATGIVFGTVPTTVAMLQGWAWLSRAPLGDAMRTVMLVNIICVLFVTWLYETLFLIRERVDDQVQLTRALADRTQAELDALRARVDPHFLFNALNTLAALIDTRPTEAQTFVDHLALVYRRLLDTRGRAIVPLVEELELARAYASLVRIRFGDAVRTTVIPPTDPQRWWIPPGSAQVLLENAVRHNAIDPDRPLDIEIDASDGRLVVTHERRGRVSRPGAGLGLSNLDARARASTGFPIIVDRGERFRVTVPMVAL